MSPETAAPVPVALCDAARLASLHAACFPAGECWDAAGIAGLLAHGGSFGFALFSADACDGFLLMRAGGGESEILTLCTAPAARCKGLATRLVRRGAEEALARGAEAIFLEVAADNAPARALYARLGFAVAGRRAAYYRRGAAAMDALVLRAGLPLRAAV
jgi:ribosomal-protein-alanine N-acetyltransferase